MANHGRRKLTICLRCLALQDYEVQAKSVICQNCGFSISLSESTALANVSHDLASSWSSTEIVEELAKQGIHPSLLPPEPTEFLWAVAALVVQGIISGVAYDVVKTGARLLYEKYKSRGKLRKDTTPKDSEALKKLPKLFKEARDYVAYYGEPDVSELRKLQRTIRAIKKVNRAGSADIEVLYAPRAETRVSNSGSRGSSSAGRTRRGSKARRRAPQ